MARYNKGIASSYGLGSPLIDTFPAPIRANRAPTVNDRAQIGQSWIDENPDSITFNGVWVLVKAAGAESTWEATGNTAAGGSSTTKYVVDADGTGDFTTIQAALDKANADAQVPDVFLRPGTYTEDLIFYGNSYISSRSDSGVIVGKHTPSITGPIVISSCRLESATHIFDSAVAGAALINIKDSLVAVTAGFTYNLPNWTGSLYIDNTGTGDTNNGIVNNTAGAVVVILKSQVGAGTNTMLANGFVQIADSIIGCRSTFAGSSTGQFLVCEFLNTVTLSGSIAARFPWCSFVTGLNSSLVQNSSGAVSLEKASITNSNVNAIGGTGAGAITLGSVTFLNSSTVAAPLTLAYNDTTRGSLYLCGDSNNLVTEFSANSNIMQSYGNDDTPTGATARSAMSGSLNVTAGDGGNTPNATSGEIYTKNGSNCSSAVGLSGFARQEDGSIIGGTISGIYGRLDIKETNAASLPGNGSFGIRSYITADDLAAVQPSSFVTGVGSQVNYSTPFDQSAFGFLATRFNSGLTGTAARAAYGIHQGTKAIPDWDYAVDLYNGLSGEPYAEGDIRFRNQTGLVEGSEGMTFTGDLTTRSVIQTGTDITFTSNPLVQTAANTAGAPTGATGDINIVGCQDGIILEEYIIGAGNVILAPRMNPDGLLIALDLVATQGVEYNFGTSELHKHAYIVGSPEPFFMEATFVIVGADAVEPFLMGFRLVEPNSQAYGTYFELASFGLVASTTPNRLITATNLAGGGVVLTTSNDTWANGAIHTLRIEIDALGSALYLYDGVALAGITPTYQFPLGVTVMPFIHFVHDIAGIGPQDISMVSLKVGNIETTI